MRNAGSAFPLWLVVDSKFAAQRPQRSLLGLDKASGLSHLLEECSDISKENCIH